MSDLRVTNLKGRNPGEAPTLPDGVVITGITTVSSVIVGTGITLSSGGINITGVITATSFSGNGSGLIGVSAGIGTTGSVNTSGIITATSFFGSGSGLTGVAGTSVFAAGTAAAPSISPTGDSNTGIFFPSADTVAISEGGAEALRVDSSGRLLIGISTSGNANGGPLQLSGGITFPATAVAATDVNTLDDYEEGTWTPNQGPGLTVVGTFSSSGSYTKIGRVVHVRVKVQSSTSVACSAGGQVCTNLPFETTTAYQPGSATNHSNNVSNGGMAFQYSVYNFESFLASETLSYCITYSVS